MKNYIKEQLYLLKISMEFSTKDDTRTTVSELQDNINMAHISGEEQKIWMYRHKNIYITVR